jgi:hypothetical protein
MTDPDEALNSVLAADRPTPQRLELLQTLREELRGEKAVLALLAAAREEKTLQLRRAFFQHAVTAEITRISDRAAYVDGILYFATLEDELDLRSAALARLGDFLAHAPVIEDVLLESLSTKLDAGAQAICLEALLGGRALRPENLPRLLAFIPHCPPELRGELIDLLSEFDATTVQSGLVVLLDPAETPEIRGRALEELAALPRLEPATLHALETLVLNEPSSTLQARVVAILRESKQLNPELFKVIFSLFLKYPDRVELLEALRHRLASFPELLPALSDKFRSLRSAQLRVRILTLLEKTPAVPLFIAALRDPSPQVRLAAVKCCAHHHANYAAEIERNVLAAAQSEALVSVREALARIFATSATRRAPEINRALLDWIERETEPRVERVLAQALPAIPLSSDNGGAMLRTWRKILFDPATTQEKRTAIVAQLRNAAFQDAPELAGCLRLLLERASSIEDVDNLYARLRELEPDAGAHAELILTLFFRFAGDFPRAPLNGWLKDFESLAPTHPFIREQIPTIVRMTGASWISSSADVAAQQSILLPSLMEQIRRGNWIESGRLLRVAWENRTIRKSDMLIFFKKLLRMPGEESLMLSTLVMMAKGGLITPEIFNLSFGYLQEFPRNGSYTSLLADFLQGRNQDPTPMRSINEVRIDLETARQKDPEYRERLFAAFNERSYARYWHGIPEELEFIARPDDWNNWEYQLWPDKSNSWVIARLFFALKPFDRIATLLASPVNPIVSRARSIHYLLLLQIWQNLADDLPPTVLDELLRGIGALIRNTAGRPGDALLYDRAVLVFRKYWSRQINSPEGGRSVAPDLAEFASDVYVALCEVSANFDTAPEKKFPAKFPELLQGLDPKRLEKLWHFGAESWQRLFKEYFEGADEDAAARALYETAQAIEAAARFEDAFKLYDELMTQKTGTRFFKNMRSHIHARRDDCDPSRPFDPAENEGAKVQYKYLHDLIEQKNFDSALRTLDRLLKRWWRTPLIMEKRAELVAKRTELQALLPARESKPK